MSTVVIECESNIRIPITKEIYKEIRDKETNCKEDHIFIYNNGIRLSHRMLQKKITTTRKMILGFNEGVVYPITRTTSTEELVSIKELNDSSIIIKKITRLIIIKDTYYKNNINVTIRKSLNEENTIHGSIFWIECEIEYDKMSTYEDILKYEDVLMAMMKDESIYLNPDVFNLEHLYSAVGSKIQSWNCFNDKETYRWAYKFNGIKGKMIWSKDDNCIYIWPDVGPIKTYRCNYKEKTNSLFEKFFFRACCQIEIMQDAVIIVELISAMYDSIMFVAEPHFTVQALMYIKTHLKHIVDFMEIDNKKIKIQQFFEPPIPKEYSNPELYDGFIIAQNDMLIKWKLPTIDIMYIGDNKFTVAGKIILLPEQNLFLDYTDEHGEQRKIKRLDLIQRCIYEVSPDMKILRKRHDRIAPSNEAEYENFLISVKILKEKEAEENISE